MVTTIVSPMEKLSKQGKFAGCGEYELTAEYLTLPPLVVAIDGGLRKQRVTGFALAVPGSKNSTAFRC